MATSYIVIFSVAFTAGRDVKSVSLNVASTLLLLLPVALYFLENAQHRWMFGGFVGLVLAIAILIPPVGYMRPHPYSDFDDNRLPKKRS
jgi:hypothetical protein